jgi:hypothetical protein
MFSLVYHRFQAELKSAMGGSTNVETCTKQRHQETESVNVSTVECRSLFRIADGHNVYTDDFSSDKLDSREQSNEDREANIKNDVVPLKGLGRCDQGFLGSEDPEPVAGARLDKLCSSLSELRLAVSEHAIDFGSFTYVKSNTLLTFVQLGDDVNAAVKLCVVIDDSLAIRVHVFGYELSNTHTVFQELPTVVNSVGSVVSVLKFFSEFCECEAVDYSALMNSNLMSHLSGTRKSLMTDLMHCKQPNQSLTSPVKLQKLRQLAQERKQLQRTISSLKNRLQTSRNKCTASVKTKCCKTE